MAKAVQTYCTGYFSYCDKVSDGNKEKGISFFFFFFKGFLMIGNLRESSPLQRGRHDTLTLREVQAGACQVPVDGEAECREC